MWHQPCQRYKYTTSVDIKKKRRSYKASRSCRTTCERSESAQESGEERYISDHQSMSFSSYVHVGNVIGIEGSVKDNMLHT